MREIDLTGEAVGLLVATFRDFRGESRPAAKMTYAKADQLRAYRGANPEATLSEVGQKFGVGRETARKVIKEIAWKRGL